MPTPPLPLFRALLKELNIPLDPPTITSIPPSLLLLTLETILGERLPLPHQIRLCATPADEVGVIKCVLGVMGDDELGMDLGLIDPLGVVHGDPDMMGVIIMALIVIAKRRGVVVRPEQEWDEGLDWEEGGSSESLVDPLVPDISFSGMGPTSPISPSDREQVRGEGVGDGDVFGYYQNDDHSPNGTLFKSQFRATPSPVRDSEGTFPTDSYITPLPYRTKGDLVDDPAGAMLGSDMDPWHPARGDDLDHTIDEPIRPQSSFRDHPPQTHHHDTWSRSDITTSSGRTVLQEMLDEFGLSAAG